MCTFGRGGTGAQSTWLPKLWPPTCDYQPPYTYGIFLRVAVGPRSIARRPPRRARNAHCAHTPHAARGTSPLTRARGRAGQESSRPCLAPDPHTCHPGIRFATESVERRNTTLTKIEGLPPLHRYDLSKECTLSTTHSHDMRKIDIFLEATFAITSSGRVRDPRPARRISASSPPAAADVHAAASTETFAPWVAVARRRAFGHGAERD